MMLSYKTHLIGLNNIWELNWSEDLLIDNKLNLKERIKRTSCTTSDVDGSLTDPLCVTKFLLPFGNLIVKGQVNTVISCIKTELQHIWFVALVSRTHMAHESSEIVVQDMTVPAILVLPIVNWSWLPVAGPLFKHCMSVLTRSCKASICYVKRAGLESFIELWETPVKESVGWKAWPGFGTPKEDTYYYVELLDLLNTFFFHYYLDDMDD